MVLSTPYLQGIWTPTNLFSTRHRLIKGYGLVIAATAIWSGNFIVARIIANSVPPVSTTVLRSLVAGILMAPFVIRPFYRELPLIRKHLGYLTLAAFMGLTVCNTAVYVAATTTNALNLTLIAIFSPIFTIVFARIFLRDTLTFRRVIGLIAATAGVILLITGGQISKLVHLTFARGDLWMLAQASSFAFYTILVRVNLLKSAPPFSCVRLIRVEGSMLCVHNVDMLNGTPLLDIKPYVPRADCFEATRIGWLEGKDTGETIGDAGDRG